MITKAILANWNSIPSTMCIIIYWLGQLGKIISLEKVQQFALRMCAKYFHATYENLLHLFFAPSLRNRTLCLSLCTFYFISAFPTTEHCTPHHVINSEFQPSCFHSSLLSLYKCFKIFFLLYSGIVCLQKLIPLSIYYSLNITFLHLSP